MIKTINLRKLIISLAIPIITGLISSIFTQNASELFDSLIKPPLSPPAIVFSIVWSILYILIGISLYLAGNEDVCIKKANRALVLGLLLNIIWCAVFFAIQQFFIALLILLLIWGLSVYTLICYYNLNKYAAITLLPYILWLTFAAYLNMAIVCLN